MQALRKPFGVALCAAAVLLLAPSARATIVSVGGGNPDAVPLYRALAFGSINFANETTNGIDYFSNFAPLPMANGSTAIAHNGATLTTVAAAAYSGFYAARNYAQITVTNANSADDYYAVAGQGTATTVQFFTPEVAAARARFTWHVTGTTLNPSGVGDTTCPTPIPAPGCFPASTGRLDFGASIDPATTWVNLFDDPNNKLDSITRFGPGTFTYDLPVADLGEVIRLFYWSSAYAQINEGEVAQGSTFSLTADYYNTVVLEGVELFDALDNPISEWTLQDMTDPNAPSVVFNQNGRQVPVEDAPALPTPPDLPVPEPSGIALLSAAALAAAGARKRRRDSALTGSAIA
jgi:hypothetical protein